MNMKKMPEDFSRFGKHFQESMVQLMLEDRNYCDQITEVLDINFFELSYLQTFVSKILMYRERYKVHPTYKTMITILRTELDSEHNLEEFSDKVEEMIVKEQISLRDACYWLENHTGRSISHVGLKKIIDKKYGTRQERLGTIS